MLVYIVYSELYCKKITLIFYSTTPKFRHFGTLTYKNSTEARIFKIIVRGYEIFPIMKRPSSESILKFVKFLKKK